MSIIVAYCELSVQLQGFTQVGANSRTLAPSGPALPRPSKRSAGGTDVTVDPGGPKRDPPGYDEIQGLWNWGTPFLSS